MHGKRAEPRIKQGQTLGNDKNKRQNGVSEVTDEA
jgi:hypothetical protein